MSVQHKICEDAKHDIKQYTLKHSYCSDIIFNKPSEWIEVDRFYNSTEFGGYSFSEINLAIEALEKDGQIELMQIMNDVLIKYKKG